LIPANLFKLYEIFSALIIVYPMMLVVRKIELERMD
jgi:hypothetical protein